jgi:septal ring factor EnvC (AmiA/AmiB activator)
MGDITLNQIKDSITLVAAIITGSGIILGAFFWISNYNTKKYLDEQNKKNAEVNEKKKEDEDKRFQKFVDDTKAEFDMVNQNIACVKKDVAELSKQVKKIDSELSPIKKSIKVIFEHLEKTTHTEKIEKAKIDYEDKLMGISE